MTYPIDLSSMAVIEVAEFIESERSKSVDKKTKQIDCLCVFFFFCLAGSGDLHCMHKKKKRRRHFRSTRFLPYTSSGNAGFLARTIGEGGAWDHVTPLFLQYQFNYFQQLLCSISAVPIYFQYSRRSILDFEGFLICLLWSLFDNDRK